MLLDLPDDVLLCVFSNLHARDIAKLECVCKRMKRLVINVDICIPSQDAESVLPWCLQRSTQVSGLSLRNMNTFFDGTQFPKLRALRVKKSVLPGLGITGLRYLDITTLAPPGLELGRDFLTSSLPQTLETCGIDLSEHWERIVVDTLPPNLRRLNLIAGGDTLTIPPIVVEDLGALTLLDLSSTSISWNCQPSTRLRYVRFRSYDDEESMDLNHVMRLLGPHVENLVMYMPWALFITSSMMHLVDPRVLSLNFSLVVVDYVPPRLEKLSIVTDTLATCTLKESIEINAKVNGRVLSRSFFS